MRPTAPIAALLVALGVAAVAAPPEDDRRSLIALAATDLDALSGMDADIEGGTPGQVHAHVRPDDVLALQEAGVALRVLADDVRSLRPVEPSEGRGMAYHEPDGVSWSLRGLASGHPDVVRVLEVGRSWDGRAITGVLMTDRPWTREPDEPSMRLLGTHHGDEWSSMEVPLDLAWTLAEAYDAGDERVVEFLDSHELWVVPVVNPDGVVAFERRNSRNVDLNRNYAHEWEDTSASGDHPFSEVETAAIHALSLARSFHHSLTMHSGATNIGWVWNYTSGDTDDEPLFESLAAAYSENTDQPDFWITQGGAWYTTNGDTNDWSYGVRGGHDYTLEVTLEKAPPAEQINEFLGYHTWPSIEFLLDGADSGIRGRVVGRDGRGIEAWLAVDSLAIRAWTDPETGAFARPLLPGLWTVTVGAPGYAEQTAEVLVEADSPTPIDVELVPLSDVVVTEVFDLELEIADGGEPLICAPGADLDAGVTMVRADQPEVAVPFEVVGDCVVLEVDPGALPIEPWALEGEWTLLVGGATLPQALLLMPDDPDYFVGELEVEVMDDGLARVDVIGYDLPEGSLVRFRGPQGQRAWPLERLVDDELKRVSAVVDTSGWADGTWAVRVFGRGHHAAPRATLVMEDGELSVDPGEPPTEDPTDEPTEEPTEEPTGEVPDDDDSTPADGDDLQGSGTGCTCSASNEQGGGVLPLALALLAVARYTRRPRRTSP